MKNIIMYLTMICFLITDISFAQAIKKTKIEWKGKKIEVVINKIPRKGEFEIIVSDEGIGIEKEDIPLLFERFAVSNKSNSLNS